MKKKILNLAIAFALILMMLLVTGCGSDNNEDTESNEQNNESSTEVSQNLKMTYLGVDVTPGTAFDENAIDEEYEFSEITSCAFEGTDKVYTYSGVEITVAQMDGVDTVYSVYFLNDEPETEKGVKIADDEQVMLDNYGEEYTSNVENQYSYTDNNITLSFIVENETIISIEYVLNI